MNQAEDFSDLRRDEYLRKTKEILQNSIVNFKSTETSTFGDYIWTYKSTYCDVISIVTTTIPFRNAAMKDIKFRNKELRR